MKCGQDQQPTNENGRRQRSTKLGMINTKQVLGY